MMPPDRGASQNILGLLRGWRAEKLNLPSGKCTPCPASPIAKDCARNSLPEANQGRGRQAEGDLPTALNRSKLLWLLCEGLHQEGWVALRPPQGAF